MLFQVTGQVFVNVTYNRTGFSYIKSKMMYLCLLLPVPVHIVTCLVSSNERDIRIPLFYYKPSALLVRLCAPFTLPTVSAIVNVISQRYMSVLAQSA